MHAEAPDTTPTTKPWWQTFHWAQFIYGLILLGMIGYAGHRILTDVVPVENKDIALLLLGNILGILGASMAFWHNTTASGDKKTDMLLNSVPIQPKPQEPDNANRTL